MLHDLKAFEPLRGQAFRRLWLAHHVSNFGDLIQAAGVAWLMVTLTRSVEMVALVQTAAALPYMLLALFSGALADAYNRSALMVCSRLVGFCIFISLAICTLCDQLTPWLLIGLVFLTGCSSTLYAPAWQVSIGDLVAKDNLAAAVVLNDTSFNLNRSLAPAVSGFLLANVGVVAPFLLGVFSYLPSIAILALWPPQQARAERQVNLYHDVASAVLLVARSRQLRAIMFRSFVFGFGACSANALIPVMSRDTFHAGPSGFGLLLACSGAGAVAAVLVNFRLRGLLSSESIVVISFVASASGSLFLAFATQLQLAALAMFLAGAGWLFAFSSFNTAVQILVARAAAGRALSIFHAVSFAGIALGSWVWGALSDDAGVKLSLLLSTPVLACGILIGLRTPMIEITPRLRPMHFDASN